MVMLPRNKYTFIGLLCMVGILLGMDWLIKQNVIIVFILISIPIVFFVMGVVKFAKDMKKIRRR